MNNLKGVLKNSLHHLSKQDGLLIILGNKISRDLGVNSFLDNKKVRNVK
jgi:hypothetical protein